ncbi:hypothetical protein HU200_013054 [Digitaria exilis]|uniref:Gnk2-homologous domain-containing protein n=1 Tax=Digitaria exilis TaxID=1010633 RepID=A0A835FDW0_9POAL|nr:hypothetical protein HU200_013054 [Digitaria exilis]
MKNSSLLSLLVLVAAWPLTAPSGLACHAAPAAATTRPTAPTKPTSAASQPSSLPRPPPAAASHRPRYGGYKQRAFGYWPNRLQAAWSCDARDETSDGACAACVAEAFKSVERECPFHREAFFFNGSCSLRLSEYRILGSDAFVARMLVMGMMFQAFGLSCLFFLFLQAWRHDIKKGTIAACITMALKEGRIACPDHREFVFSNGNCTLQLYGFQFDDLNTMESGIVSMAPESEFFHLHFFLLFSSYLLEPRFLFNIATYVTRYCSQSTGEKYRPERWVCKNL